MGMKRFLAKPDKIDKKTAGALLALNLVFPGLGSIYGGKKSGYFQIVLSLAGLGGTLYYVGKMIMCIAPYSDQIFQLIIPLEVSEKLLELLKPLIGSFIIFFISLVWSLITNLIIYKEAKDN